LAVAYVTPDGVDALVKRLALRLAPRQISEVNPAIVTSFDFGFSVPKALRALADVHGFDVRIANLTPGTARPRTASRSFHTKIYLASGRASSGIFVGSANLTARALSVNTEAGFLELGMSPGTATTIRNELLGWGEPLSAGLLAEYAKWRKGKPSPEPPPVTPPIKPPHSLGTLQEAIVTGVNPASFDYMWVEAGSMRSGGSHNQLELPRGANRFFGFAYTAYAPVKQLPLGDVTVIVPGVANVLCRLTWHGHNMMERLNLPTKAKGGYYYARTVVLFAKRANGYAIYVEPQGSHVANAWEAASQSTQLMFRLGGGSPRRCGFF
jgi:hypothetical protein